MKIFLAAFALALGLAVVSGTPHPLAAQTGSAGPGDGAETMRARIDALASEHGFAVRGLDRLGDEEAWPVEGDVARRIEALLANYDFMLVRGPGGTVETVLISGRKQLLVTRPSRLTVETSRRGAHHVVEALVAGPGGVPRTVRLVIDTGASTVVLPTSMIAALGYGAGDLDDQVMQTANGQVTGKSGILSSVDVGGAVTRDVAVSFIDDERLGGIMLLGMSYLGRYGLTIDDDNNLITLVRKN